MPARKKSNSVERSDEEGDFEMVDSSSSKKTNNKKKQRSESVEVVEDSDEGDKSSSKSKKAAKKPASKKSKLALDEEEGEEDDVVNVDEEEGEEGDDDDVYTIEKILKHRMSEDTGTYEYLIRWEGYGVDDDTWEPEANCETAPILVAKYWKDQPTHKQPRKMQEVKKKLEKIKSPNKRGNKSAKGNASDEQGSEGEIEDAVDLASAGNGSSKRKKRKSPSDEQDEEEEAKRKARIEETERLLVKWNKFESWEDEIEVVETISQEDDGVLRAHIKLNNGDELWVNVREAYKKCPQAMLAFYESHLRFRASHDSD